MEKEYNENIKGEKSVKNKKLKKKILIAIGIILIICGLTLLVFRILNNRPAPTKNIITDGEVQSNYSFSMSCYKEDNLILNEIKAGQKIVCFLEFDAKKYNSVEKITATINTSNSLKYEGMSTDDNWSSSSDGNNITITKIVNNEKDSSRFYLTFSVNDNFDENDLNVNIDNVQINYNNNIYLLNDFSYKIEKDNTIWSFIYIYAKRNENGESIEYASNELPSSYDFIIYSYHCTSLDCGLKNFDRENSTMYFKDNNKYYSYNYLSKKLTEYNFGDNIDNIQFVFDNTKIVGAEVTFNDKTQNLYLFSSNKYFFPNNVINLDTNNLYDFGFVYTSDCTESKSSCTGKIIDIATNKIIFSKELQKSEAEYGLLSAVGTKENYYIALVQSGLDEENYKFYDLNKNLINTKEVYSYTILSNGDLIIPYNVENYKFNQYIEYNKNGEVVKKSYNYTEIEGIFKDYFVAIKDNKLKLFDYNENEVTTFCDWNDTLSVERYISGYWEKNGKNGLYIVVSDPSVTDEEIKKDNPDVTDELIDENGYDRGYEYYYIPSTNETGKIASEIGGYAKPILYLYPQKNNTKITVKFSKPNQLTTTYPKYNNSWEVIANKNGDLYDSNGKYYYALYWEEKGSINVTFNKGFYVTKDNASEFLENKLTEIGLNAKERNEFIMYWLPVLEKNGQSLVYFEFTNSRENYNKLIINPKPDSLLRIAIHIKKVNNYVNISEENIPKFTRKGFAAIEWGGVIHTDK
jgi:hypothetical protein